MKLSLEMFLSISLSQRLPRQIEERNEKLKEEMMSMITFLL